MQEITIKQWLLISFYIQKFDKPKKSEQILFFQCQTMNQRTATNSANPSRDFAASNWHISVKSLPHLFNLPSETWWRIHNLHQNFPPITGIKEKGHYETMKNSLDQNDATYNTPYSTVAKKECRYWWMHMIKFLANIDKTSEPLDQSDQKLHYQLQ